MKKLLTSALVLGMSAFVSLNVCAVDQPYADNVASQDDIESLYAFTLEGTEYTLPFSAEDLRANGWDFYYSTDATEKIPGMTVQGCWMVKDSSEEKMIIVTFLNATGNAMEMQNARVAGIDVESDAAVEFALESGLKIGSTAEEVEAVYGAPESDSYEYEFSELLREKGTDLQESMRDMSLMFSEAADSDSTMFEMDDSQTVSEIELNYYKTFEEDATEPSARPAYLDAYAAPAALGAGLTPLTFELDGAAYQLPMPLSVFLENGWTLDEESVVYGLGDNSSVYISNGDRRANVEVENLDEMMVNVQDTVVTSIQFFLDDNWSADALKLPYGITNKTTDEELKSLLPALNKVQLDGTSGSLEKDDLRYYVSDYKADDSDYHSYSAQVSDMENENNRISVNYTLDEANTPDFIVIYSDSEWIY